MRGFCWCAAGVASRPPALAQLVAIDDCARIARHIVEDAALDKRVYARVTEQDQRRTIIIAARIACDLPSLREQLVDSSAVSPLPPSWTPLASLPSRGLNACETLKPLNGMSPDSIAFKPCPIAPAAWRYWPRSFAPRPRAYTQGALD
jgi:hypothetical protein